MVFSYYIIKPIKCALKYTVCEVLRKSVVNNYLNKIEDFQILNCVRCDRYSLLKT